MKISLGPSGSPKPSTLEGLGEIRRLGLDAMELSFTHGVRMGVETAKDIGKANEKTKLKLSIHAPYYINLCSEDEQKREDSIKRILDTCERAHYIGAKNIIFHTAYYGKLGKEEAFDVVKKAIEEMKYFIDKKRWDVDLLPETSGRVKQFGSIEEILEIARKTKSGFCIDIAHIYARNLGHIHYENVFDLLEEAKQKELHFHFEGIETNKGGEDKHLVITGNKPDFKDFARELVRRGTDSTIISESPVTWQDSLRMKKILEDLGHRFDRND